MANAAAISLTELDGVFKDKRAEALQKAVPQFAVLQRDVPLTQKAKLGRNYIFPVHLRRSHGVTYNGGANTAAAFSLNSVVSPVYQEAQIDGSELVVREAISYGALSRGTGGDKSFAVTILEVARNLKESADFHCELSLLYGDPTATNSVGIGNIATVGATGATRTIDIATKTWAPGIWTQLEGGLIDIYTAAGTKINAQDVYVKAVDADNRQITASSTSGAGIGAITNTMHLVPKGFHTNSFVGLNKILQNTGELFSISASDYTLWKGNVHDAENGPLSLGKVLAAVNRAVSRGLMEDCVCYMSTFAWHDLVTNHAELVRRDEGPGKVRLGSSSIEYTAGNGTVMLKPHPMVMSGDAFVGPLSRVRRVGSTATTFKIPRVKEVGGSSEFFVMLPDNAGVQMRAYWDQAMLITQPAKWTKIKNICPNSLQA